MAAFQTLIEDAGFSNVRFSDKRYDTFSDAPQASSADAFGTQGVNILAMKAAGSNKARSDGKQAVTDEPAPSPVLDTLPDADALYDAGDLGCGDGPIMEVSQRLKGMPPGSLLEIRSTDPTVASDLPAWCRMTGHTYLGHGTGSSSGRHFVERKRD